MPGSSNNKNVNEKTIEFYIREFFMKHPNQDIQQQIVAKYVWKFRDAMDTHRLVRSLFEQGWLKFVKKGVYRYEPGYQGPNLKTPFSTAVKEAIFKKDNYRCQSCLNGRHNGYELHADHMTPQARGGNSTVENGQTLCSECNMLKKNRTNPEFLKKLVERCRIAAKVSGDTKSEKMFIEIIGILTKIGTK